MTVRKACVIGWPVKHSRSPLIHMYWLKKYGLQGTYEKHEVCPEALGDFLWNLPNSSYVGCNVTIPHKERTFEIVEVTDETTKKLGVVNTVFIDGDKVCGISTDGEGFIQSLLASQSGYDLRNKHITLLGAGGAARAIAGTLATRGVSGIAIANRTINKAKAIQHDFGKVIYPVDWKNRSEILPETDILVNTTSLGMTGQPPQDIDLEKLKPDTIVADIVYVPLETRLLTKAKSRGNPIVYGLGMLLHQAVRGFELWFGKRPEVTQELYELVAADIVRKAE